MNSRVQTIRIFLLLILCSFGSVRAQNAPFARVDNFNAEYHVERKVPEGFQVTSEYSTMALDTGWDKRRDLGGIWVKSTYMRPAICGTFLRSDDRQCTLIYHDIVDLQFFPRFDNDLSFRGAYAEQRWGHRGEILEILMTQLGRSDFRYDDHVSSVAGREARKRFRADSVFTFAPPVNPQIIDGTTYTHCVMLYLSRKNRAYLGFTFLLTDKGYERRAAYMQALEGAVRYRPGRWRNQPEWIERQNRELRWNRD